MIMGMSLAIDGARLENLVATTLLKRLHFIEDYYGYRAVCIIFEIKMGAK